MEVQTMSRQIQKIKEFYKNNKKTNVKSFNRLKKLRINK